MLITLLTTCRMKNLQAFLEYHPPIIPVPAMLLKKRVLQQIQLEDHSLDELRHFATLFQAKMIISLLVKLESRFDLASHEIHQIWWTMHPRELLQGDCAFGWVPDQSPSITTDPRTMNHNHLANRLVPFIHYTQYVLTCK